MTVSSALVVGASGFVGSHIARELIGAGCAVTGFGPPMSIDLVGDLAGRLNAVHGSAENPAEIDAAFAAAKPEVVVWAAGHNANAAGLMATGEAETARALTINAVGLFNVLDAARRHGVKRAIVTGSLVSFGPSSFYSEPYVDESAVTRPTTGYGLSKAMGEQVARYFRDRFGMDVTTFRLAVVFGPGRWYGGVVATLNRLLEQAKPGVTAECEVPGDIFDLVHVRDVALAVRLAAESTRPLRSVYHLNSFATSYPELVRAIETQVPGFKVVCRTAAAPVTYPLMAFDQIQRDLGFRPQFDVQSAIADCLRSRP